MKRQRRTPLTMTVDFLTFLCAIAAVSGMEEGCAVANHSRWARHDGQENVERAHAVIPFWWLIERELAFGWKAPPGSAEQLVAERFGYGNHYGQGFKVTTFQSQVP
ncbi:ephrin type-B receptor 1-B isoform X1, partial [Tachysurus ichikawai]